MGTRLHDVLRCRSLHPKKLGEAGCGQMDPREQNPSLWRGCGIIPYTTASYMNDKCIDVCKMFSKTIEA